MSQKPRIETDLSRFVNGQAYMLGRSIHNPKVDRRMKNGGSELSAHSVLPEGLRFVLSIVEHTERPMGPDVDLVQVERIYMFTAFGGHAFRYFKLEARDVRRFVNGEETTRIVWVLPHHEDFPEHHAVKLAAIEALVPEPVTLSSLEDRIDEVSENGWTVIKDLLHRGLVSISNVETSVNTIIERERQDRAERLAEGDARRNARKGGST